MYNELRVIFGLTTQIVFICELKFVVCYQGKPFCYLWRDKKSFEPYIGLVRSGNIAHPNLFLGNRKKMKIMRIDPNLDIPVDTMYEIFEELRANY